MSWIIIVIYGIYKDDVFCHVVFCCREKRGGKWHGLRIYICQKKEILSRGYNIQNYPYNNNTEKEKETMDIYEIHDLILYTLTLICINLTNLYETGVSGPWYFESTNRHHGSVLSR